MKITDLFRGALFHPAFVHFPIAFCFLELLLLIFWASKKDAAYQRFADFSFRLGYGFIIAATVTGFLAAGGFGKITGVIATHFYSALAVFSFYTLRIIYKKYAGKTSARYVFFEISGAVLGNALIAATAYFGGKLVYQS